jgi:hypothetical protein
MKITRIVPLLSALLSVGCEPAPHDPALTSAAHALFPEDPSAEDIYGERNNGRSLTGEVGPGLIGVAYAGAVLVGGQPVTDVAVIGGRLRGRMIGAGGVVQVVDGPAWTGAILQGQTPNGLVPIRIDGVDTVDADLHLYTLSRPRHGAQGPAWTPFCHAYDDGDVRAVPVAARWNDNGDRVESSDHFTFGCRSGAIAKCVLVGYRPWLPAQGAAPMVDVHQACTRAITADFCGNGKPHTLNGTPINIVDQLAPPIRPQFIDVRLYEAAWTRYGAYCLSHARWDFLQPECDMQSEPGIPRGPFSRDANGGKLAPRTCDDPAAAAAMGTPVQLFTESLEQGKDDLPTQ